MSRLIIYGDIHGCYDELISLRSEIKPQKDDIEVCVGDIITKGKYSIKVLDFIIENNIRSVLGNHEDKLLRYLNHQKLNKSNPIELDSDEQNIINHLSFKHIEFLQGLPLFLRFGDITVVHGGIQNHINLDDMLKKDKQRILRLRYLDENHEYLIYGKENDNSVLWADIYDGSQGFIVYGHQNFDKPKISQHAIGIDTGCVYGNMLSGVVFYNTKLNLEYQIYSYKSCTHNYNYK